ncbi:MAG: conjugal transfer protein TraE [Clostridia bacterium]
MLFAELQAKIKKTPQAKTPQTANKQKLTGQQKQQVKDIKQKHNKNTKEKSAQESIPFKKMYMDGICNVKDDFFSKTIVFEDITYQLAENDDKSAIFDGWCGFLNYFDPQISFQFSFLNLAENEDNFAESVELKKQDDEFNSIREEYSNMLLNQLSRGNNGTQKTMYLTFGAKLGSYKKAKTRLESIEVEIQNNFKRLGVRCKILNGKERLALMHLMLRMEDNEKFNFEWDWLPKTGLSVKDYIAPSSFNFDGRTFKTGARNGAMSFLQVLAPEISDRILSDFLDIDGNQAISIHMKSIDHLKAIKMVKSKLTDLERTKIDQQKKAVSEGYDMEILSADLMSYIDDMKSLLKDLQSRNERLFIFTLIAEHTDLEKDKLDNTIFTATSLAQKQSCILYRLDYMQEEGFFSMLPLGINLVPINRSINTTASAGFMPFTTSELFQKHDDALYYGLNALSNNLIMADRKLLKTPNGLILGTPGSGKSFSAKREITNVFFVTNDDIAILDPENEYSELVERLNGQIIRISPLSSHYINPMDINLDIDDDPFILKSDFILSLFEIMMGRVEADERSIIDLCLQRVYLPFIADPVNTPIPILEDLYQKILNYGTEQSRHIAECMQIYVTGSLNVFNHRTNVDINNRVVCYDTKELGNALKEFGMLVVQDQIWSRVSKNRDNRKSTRYYIDEMHLLLNKEQTANYTVEIWKRFRKWGGIPTGLTQNVKDFLLSPQVSNIFENSDFVYLLNQAGGDRGILAKQLNISSDQLSYVTNSSTGEGLLIYGNIIIPFADHFPQDTELYKLMTTRLSDKFEKSLSQGKNDV